MMYSNCLTPPLTSFKAIIPSIDIAAIAVTCSPLTNNFCAFNGLPLKAIAIGTNSIFRVSTSFINKNEGFL